MKKTHVVKVIVKIICFLLVLILLLHYVSRVFCPKWLDGTSETYVTEGFYDLEKDSLDVCLVGNSQIIFGLNAMKMYEDYGISAYSLATGSQPMLISYHWLKEVVKTQDISTVVMDVSGLYGEKENFSYRKSIDSMPFSLNKIQAVFAYAEEMGEDKVATGLFNLLEYHDRWEQLSAEDFNYRDSEGEYEHRGSVMTSQVRTQGITYDDIMIDNDETDDSVVMETDKEYFIKIIEYCKENGLNLVLIKTPRKNWSLTRHNQVQEIISKYDLEFIDFCTDEMLQEIGFDYTQDMKNAEHLNTRGADKVTAWLSEYLLSKYEFEDVREDEDFYPGDIEQYHKEYQDVYMKSGKSISEALEYLSDARYDTVIWSTDDISTAWTAELQNRLKALGIANDVSMLSEQNYVFTLHGGVSADELVDENPISCASTFSNGASFEVISDNAMTPEEAVITVNGEKITLGKNGMHLLIYDNEKGRVVDTVTFFLSKETLKMTHK